MRQNDDDSITWTHTRRLYCEWGNLKACLKAFAIAIAICFVLTVVIGICADGMSAKGILLWCKVWGLIFLGFELTAILAYYLWAWAQGGVDEWEYTMVKWRVTGRKIVHKAWRMKVLRAFAWVLMLAPSRPGQKMALRQLLYDNTQKEVDIWFCSVKGVSGNEKRGVVVLDTKNGKKEIGVPREDYAEILAHVTENIQPPKPRKRGESRRKKPNHVT